MGNENSGRKPLSYHSAAIKERMAEIASEGVRYLYQVSKGQIRKPSAKRIEVILNAIAYTLGKPKTMQDVDVNIQVTIAELIRNAHIETVEQIDIIEGDSKDELQKGVYEALPEGSNDIKRV